jgi:predicted ATPase
VGPQFDVETVAQLCAASRAECSEALTEAVRAGLLLSPESDDYLAGSLPLPQSDPSAPPIGAEPTVAYRFLHERVQQAVYATLDLNQRQDCHLRIGQLRLAQWGPDAAAGRLFDLVNHLNLGSARMRERGDEAGLYALAKRNLSAGLRAKATAAFHAAARYFGTGASLLPESAWSSQHELLFELHWSAHTVSHSMVTSATRKRSC